MDEVDRLPVVVIGTGAAGLVAAIHAAAGTRPVLLLEGSERPGQKILISGGGRCNVLPSQASHTDFVSDSSPNLVRKVLAAWPLAEVRRFFEADLGVPLKLETETGKLFPASDRARTVLDALLTAYVQRGGPRVHRHARDRSAAQGRLLGGAAFVGRDDPRCTGRPGDRRALGACHRQRRRGSAHRARARPRHRPHLSHARAADGQQSRASGAGGGVGAGAGVGSGRRTKDQRPREVFHGRRSSVVGRLVPRRLPLHSPRLQRAGGVERLACRRTRALADGGAKPALLVQWSDLDAAAWDALLRAGSGPVAAAAASTSAGAAGRAAPGRNRPGRTRISRSFVAKTARGWWTH